MMQIVAALIGAVALGGLSMAGMRYADLPRTPARQAMGQWFFVIVGLAMLAYAASAVGVPPMARYALGFLVLAGAAGTAINLFAQQRQWPLLVLLRLSPALLVVTGFVLLLHSIFTNTAVGMR